MTYKNPLMERLHSGQVTYGIWATVDSAFTAEIISAEAPDYVCVDQQHGVIDYERALGMFQAIRAGGSIPITRVVQNDPGAIMKTLDAGAAGVIVPVVNSSAEAARAVSACRYPPTGTRSFGPIRASILMNSHDLAQLAQVACIVMIETAEGLRNVEDIASTPGVDAIYVGPADLAVGLGLPPTFDRPEPIFKEAIARILKACQHNEITPGIQCTDGEMAARYAGMGYRFITVASDANLMRASIRAELARARGRSAVAVAGGYV